MHVSIVMLSLQSLVIQYMHRIHHSVHSHRRMSTLFSESAPLMFSSSSLPVSGGVTTAHQVPAVSQSAYSPPTPETPDSILSTPPQTLLTKSMPPSLPPEQSIPTITGLPPTQPTAKVTFDTLSLCVQNLPAFWIHFRRPHPLLMVFSSTPEKRCEEESRHNHPDHCSHAHHEHHGCQRHQPGDGRWTRLPAHPHFSGDGPQLQSGHEPRP